MPELQGFSGRGKQKAKEGGNGMIYFDHAATTMHKPEVVAKAVAEAIMTMGNAARGAHEASLSGMRMIYDTRRRLCAMFKGDSPEQTVFTLNATMALNIAIQGLLQPGDHVITTALEHNSVLRPLYLMESRGVALTIIPADRKGNVDVRAIEKAIGPKTRAVVCTHASNLTGNVVDIQRIGEICQKAGTEFIVDASQTAGVLPIDMQKMHISALCFTGHKGLLGPQGTGGLLVRKNLRLRPLVAGGSGVHSYDKSHPGQMPTALEAGTLNSHGIAGLHAALIYLEEKGRENLYAREHALMDRFYRGVREIPGISVYGDFQQEKRAPIVSLNIEDYDSGQVSDELMERFSIATRAGAHCVPLMHECLGTKEQGAVRFSFSHTNTEEEIDRGIEAVRILAQEVQEA